MSLYGNRSFATNTTNVTRSSAPANASSNATTSSTLANSPKYDRYWLVVSRRNQLAVTIIPKVMCTSIRCTFNRYECPQYPRDHCVTAKRDARCAEWRWNKPQLGPVNLTNFTRVLFLRDPFERAYSAYENADVNPYINTNNCPSSQHCTFEEWVQDLAAPSIVKNHNSNTTTPPKIQPIKSRNEHFIAQTTIAQFHTMHYHYHFRLSSKVDQDYFWNVLAKGMQQQTDNVSANTTTTNSTEPNNKNNNHDRANRYHHLHRPRRRRLEQHQHPSVPHRNNNNNNSRGPLPTDTKAYRKFQSIAWETWQCLAALYESDLVLWQQTLDTGTPPLETEFTVYDYYMEQLQQQQRQQKQPEHEKDEEDGSHTRRR